MAFRVNGDRVLANLTNMTGIAENQPKPAIGMPRLADSPIFTRLPLAAFGRILNDELNERRV
jgi:hypothetical protein